MRKVFLLAASAFLWILSLPGAEALNLDVDTAVGLALKNNLLLRSARIDLSTAARARDLAWNEVLPQINAGVSLSRSNEILGLDPSAWDLGVSLEAGLALSATTRYAVRNRGLAYEAGLIDLESAEAVIKRDVRKAFYSLLVAEESIRLAEQELATAEKRHRQTQANFEAGLVPRLQLLSARVSMENLKPALEQQRIERATALLNFKLLLGLGPEEEVSLRGSVEAPELSFDRDALIARYVNGRLDLRGLTKQIELLENAKRLSSAAGLSPTLSLGCSWAPGLNDPLSADWSAGGDWTDSGRLVLGLTVPLDGYVPGSKVREELAGLEDDIEKLRLELSRVRVAAEIEIESILLELEKSQSSLKALDLNVKLAQEAYDLTEEAYQAGTEELLAVQNAADELTKAQLALLNERYACLSGLLDLEYALNTDLSELEENNEQKK